MAFPKSKTSATVLRMTPETRDLWERRAAVEQRTLNSMFEAMVRTYARRLRLQPPSPPDKVAT